MSLIATSEIDPATVELVAEINALMASGLPEDVLAQAIYERHCELTNAEYEAAWPHLDATTRRLWKGYVAAEKWRVEFYGERE